MHGAQRLPLVEVDTYNEELRDADGFVGDRASNRAFRAILEDWRERLRELGEDDPLGETPSDDIPKKKLDRVLRDGDAAAAGLVHAAIEDFATELADGRRSLPPAEVVARARSASSSAAGCARAASARSRSVAPRCS